MPNFKKEKFNFVIPTVVFSIIGVFLGGLAAIILFAISKSFQFFVTGNDCVVALTCTWWTSLIGSLVSPILFFRYLKRYEVYRRQSLQTKLVFFNLLEYTLITGTISVFFSDPQVLCYGKDGQIGLEIVFTAWLSIPFLIIFSYILNKQSIIVEYS